MACGQEDPKREAHCGSTGKRSFRGCVWRSRRSCRDSHGKEGHSALCRKHLGFGGEGTAEGLPGRAMRMLGKAIRLQSACKVQIVQGALQRAQAALRRWEEVPGMWLTLRQRLVLVIS